MVLTIVTVPPLPPRLKPRPVPVLLATVFCVTVLFLRYTEPANEETVRIAPPLACPVLPESVEFEIVVTLDPPTRTAPPEPEGPVLLPESVEPKTVAIPAVYSAPPPAVAWLP